MAVDRARGPNGAENAVIAIPRGAGPAGVIPLRLLRVREVTQIPDDAFVNSGMKQVPSWSRKYFT
jgi:hypothetical protein